ncbi:MAG: hypothetical protein QXK06_05705 [Candidatus Diapherotrites archaeon]
MNYCEFLEKSARERKSIACVGIDPVLEKIPIKGNAVQETLLLFYGGILDAFESEQEWPAAFKPNYAFFAQYGFEGLKALQKIKASRKLASFESYMGCANGVCLSCVIKIRNGKDFDYVRVCKEGTVFELDRVQII